MSENNGRATLEIRDLRADVEGKTILKGIDLTVTQGETHALMGPNGSGKSTLSNAIMGRPGYVVTGGEVIFKGEKITGLTTDERARRGLVPRPPVPDGGPGRLGGELPADRVPGREGRADQRPGVPEAHEGADGSPGDRGRDGPAVREPGVLRRREEAERGAPAGGPPAGDRDPGRDGLGTRHRLPEAGRGRRGGARRPVAGRAPRSPITSGSSTTSPRTAST